MKTSNSVPPANGLEAPKNAIRLAGGGYLKTTWDGRYRCYSALGRCLGTAPNFTAAVKVVEDDAAPVCSPGWAGEPPEGVDYSSWLAMNNID